MNNNYNNKNITFAVHNEFRPWHTFFICKFGKNKCNPQS